MQKVIDLRGQNEVTFCQTVDFVRPKGDLNALPGEADVRVMTLFFGEGADPVDHRECGGEIRESERPGGMIIS